MTTPEVTPDVLTLARELAAHPRALASVRRNAERKIAERAAGTLDLRCPHCLAEPRVFRTPFAELRKRPSDCCQAALADTAARMLHAALSPLTDPVEAIEAGEEYARLRALVFTPSLAARLDALAEELANLDHRLLPLARSQGGQE